MFCGEICANSFALTYDRQLVTTSHIAPSTYIPMIIIGLIILMHVLFTLVAYHIIQWNYFLPKCIIQNKLASGYNHAFLLESDVANMNLHTYLSFYPSSNMNYIKRITGHHTSPKGGACYVHTADSTYIGD